MVMGNVRDAVCGGWSTSKRIPTVGNAITSQKRDLVIDFGAYSNFDFLALVLKGVPPMERPIKRTQDSESYSAHTKWSDFSRIQFGEFYEVRLC